MQVNNSNRTKNSVRNVATGLIVKFIVILMPFIIRTIIIKKLGMEYLGLGSLFTSIIQVLSLSDLGFSIAISFYLYKPIQNGEKDTVCYLLNYLKKIYYIVGTVILCAGLGVMPFLPHLIYGTYPADINLYVLYLIFLSNTVLSYFFFSYRRVLLNASQRSDIENVITLIVSLATYTLQIVFLLLFSNYYLYAIFMPLSTLAVNIVGLFACKKIFPDYVPSGNIPKEQKTDINHHIKAMVGHKIAHVVVNSTDSIFISAFLGLTVLAIYQNYFYIVSSLLAVVAIIYSSISASIGNYIAFESKENNLKLFNRLTFFNVLMIGWMSICLFVLYQPFMKIWVGEENMMPFLTVCLLVLHFYSWKFKEILSVFKDSAGMWTLDFWKPYVITALNIILDVVLVIFVGVDGVIIATIISVSFVSLPWETAVFYKRYFQVGPKNFYLRLLLLTILVLVAGGLTYLACYFIPDEGIGYFILKAGICLLLPNLIFLLVSFKRDEFKWLVNKSKPTIRKLLRKQ